jgi:hypothetical protein
MTRDEIIKLAREADPYGELGKLYEMAELTPSTLERFAALVAAAEREACAKVCEQAAEDSERGRWTSRYAAAECRRRIRARGEKGQS